MNPKAVALAFVLAAACSHPATTGNAACGDVVRMPDEGQSHVADGQPVTYRSDPPTSGPHFARPAGTGVYLENPPATGKLVHNLEHGHVVIWFIPGKMSDTAFKDLLDFVLVNNTRMVLVPRSTPFSDPAANVAITGWRNIQLCSGTGEGVVVAAHEFAAAFMGKGPEGNLSGTPHT